MADGYPHFLQFISKEVFDTWIGQMAEGEAPSVPMSMIEEKLDQDFFAPRWQRATNRQQDFIRVISTLHTAEDEFSVREIVAASKELLRRGFKPSNATQMLGALEEKGLVYRSRRGGYSFAVPLMARFVRRQTWDPSTQRQP